MEIEEEFEQPVYEPNLAVVNIDENSAILDFFELDFTKEFTNQLVYRTNAKRIKEVPRHNLMKFSRNTTPIPNSNRSNFKIIQQDPKKILILKGPG